MKKLITILIMSLAVLTMLSVVVQADDAVPVNTAPVVAEAPAAAESPAVLSGFSITSPMETSAVMFWFPKDGTYAGGVSHTFLRINHSAITFMSLDIDATVAEEINRDKTVINEDGTTKNVQDNHTLAGVGVKANFNTTKNTEKGFKFLPSVGVTALNDFSRFKKWNDIVDNYEIAIYGTLLSYRW